jgi:hypothetical protein
MSMEQRIKNEKMQQMFTTRNVSNTIYYNGDGVCNYCLSYAPIEYKGEPKLEELLDTG